jgi:two-component system, OmpR family, phosphate regulon sensor histidine kinase PhoR
MRNRTIKTFVVLAIVSILGIIVTQVFWFKQAFDKTEQEFNKSLNIALTQTLKGILLYNNSSAIPLDPIEKLDHNYYAVMVSDQINADVLEHYLKNEFDKLNIHQSFEYRIFDCANEQLVYGGYVEGKNSEEVEAVARNLPVWKPDNYYFTVYFPNKTLDIVSGMSLWLFSSFVLFIVLIFFAYSLFVILKQKRLSEIQKDFINNMTHEIKTPVSIISASAETIRNPNIVEQPQRLLNYANIIIEESNRLKLQVERVLALADSNRTIKLNKDKINFEVLTKEIVESICEKEKPKPIVKYEFHASNAQLIGDEVYLSNLISNIIDNAIKYSKENLEITISTRNIGNNFEITFSDNGIGIAKAHLSKIFEKFYRVPTGNRHDAKGFGIGLNYVKLIAKLHKAKVRVGSELNKGTSFIILFPNA